MRRLIAAFLLLAAAPLYAKIPLPQPDKDGVYPDVGGIKPARLVQPFPASQPDDPRLGGLKHVCTLEVVIGVDGHPGSMEVITRLKTPFDSAAIAAVRQSTFEPGKLNGKPVPTRLFVWVPFLGKDHPALPVAGNPQSVNGLKGPIPVHISDPEYTDEARHASLSGVVIVQALITEEGVASNARILRPLGKGLDENAIRALATWRFRPAMLEGVPVPFPLNVEINFRLPTS